MIAYLIKMTLCALLLYAVYALLLERENMHGFKRIYLLAGIIFSMIVPLLDLPGAEVLPTTTAYVSTLSGGVDHMIETVENQNLIIEPIVQAEEMPMPVTSSIN